MTTYKHQLARDGLAIVQFALVAGLVLQPANETQHPAISAASNPNTTSTTTTRGLSSADTDTLRSLIQNTIRQEARALPSNTQPTHMAVANTNDKQVKGKTEQEVNEEALAYQSSQDIIETALLTGYWSRDDNRQLITEMAVLNSAQRFELMDNFLTAVNEQQLELDAFPQF